LKDNALDRCELLLDTPQFKPGYMGCNESKSNVNEI